MDIIDVKKTNEREPLETEQNVVPEVAEVITDNDKKPEVPSTKTNSKMLPWILLLVVLVGGVAASMYYRNRANQAESNPTAVQQEKNQAETDRVLTSIKKVILISETDAPTVARVEDPEKLKSSNQEFYKDIQVGDYLVIYPKRAIIFRESINQIINIAPIINTADLKTDQGTTPADTKLDKEE